VLPALALAPAVSSTAVTVPLTGLTSVAAARFCCATVTCAAAASAAAWSAAS
jgi:hypothetical protein